MLLSLTAFAQDFQRNYRIGSGGTVNIQNVSGDVTVTGYNGDTITVTGFKEGRDRDEVSIEDRSSGNSVDVRVRYPENCNCEASVRFEVKVPSEISYRYNSVSSVSGNVKVSNTNGDLRAKSVSGDVTVKSAIGLVDAASVSGDVSVGEVNGTVSSKSVSGNVEVEIRSLEGAESMDFASVSGSVRVKLPGNLDADVKMSTMSGDLRTDFPLTIEEAKHGPGRRASGRIGSGSRSLKLSSVSGSVSLLRM
ncbi:MAG: DUF4097 domain-containing protein [Acidobacteria bacterium]|nr:DUF4097 domain-containing protein [Acidobacteriota bacterium]